MNQADLLPILFQTLWPIAAEQFTGTASQWMERNISFNEPGRQGQFSFYGREYLRECADFYSDLADTDMVLCFGTRSGKTTVMFGGAAYRVKQKARRALFVKPTTKGTAGAEGDARTRFIPMMRASACLRELIPTGSGRYNFKTPQQILLNGSIIDWTGSNSVANLAGNSMEDVYQDETDKFNTTRRKDETGQVIEADASELADERTGEFRNPKRVKASTPTLPSGKIWVELMKSDLRRRFVPCPLCGRSHPKSRLVVIAWNDNFTVLPKTFGSGTSREAGSKIPLAYVQWDKEARLKTGKWDLERVEKSAGYVCPHCNGRFQDEDKIWMDRNGIWQPTQKGDPRTKGYHLPSMYANHDQTTAGKLALQFIEGVHSLEGPRNVINSKFAEPYMQQDSKRERVELVTKKAIEFGDEWKKLLTVDCHQKSPKFWWVVRAWKGGDSEGIECGHAETWDDIEDIQKKHQVADAGVIVDSGFGAKEFAEVYRTCADHCELVPQVGALAMAIGWMPAKGMPGDRRWRDRETGTYLPYRSEPRDPFMGTTEAGKVQIDLFQFASEHYQEVLDRLRKGKAGYRFAISQQMDKADFGSLRNYHDHMNGVVIRERLVNGIVMERYEPRHRHWPDHLRDCEKMQVAGANFFGIFEVKEQEKKAA